MAVDLLGLPLEGVSLGPQGREVVDGLNPIVELEPVGIDDDRQVVETAVACLQQSLPHLSLLHLPIPKDHVDTPVAPVQPKAQSHTHGHGEPLAERAGRGVDAECLVPVGMALEVTAQLSQLAEVLFSLGKTEKAIETMNRTLSLSTDDAGAYASYASFLKKAGKTTEALDAYGQSFRLFDTQPRLWSDYADLLASIGRYSEAAEAYGHAISLGMSGSDTWNSYSRVLQKLGKKDEAQRAKEQAMNSYTPLPSSLSYSGNSIPSCGIGSLC